MACGGSVGRGLSAYGYVFVPTRPVRIPARGQRTRERFAEYTPISHEAPRAIFPLYTFWDAPHLQSRASMVRSAIVTAGIGEGSTQQPLIISGIQSTVAKSPVSLHVVIPDTNAPQ